MTAREEDEEGGRREYAQLLRMHERLLVQLQKVRDELVAPGTQDLLKHASHRKATDPAASIQAVTASVEEALRTLKLSESKMRQGLVEGGGEVRIEGIPPLPAALQRFLVERKEFPGFTYEVTRDEVRGWIVTWKEYTSRGTVRGFGQFYERPYAWIDD